MSLIISPPTPLTPPNTPLCLLSLLPTHPFPDFTSSSSFNNTPSPVKCCLHVCECEAIHQSINNLLVATPPKKNNSPSFRSNLLPIASQLRVESHQCTPFLMGCLLAWSCNPQCFVRIKWCQPYKSLQFPAQNVFSKIIFITNLVWSQFQKILYTGN